jgi:hypothetical protein
VHLSSHVCMRTLEANDTFLRIKSLCLMPRGLMNYQEGLSGDRINWSNK